MFDTMTIVKVGGGVLGAFLIYLLGNWAASGLYSTAVGGHGDEEHAAGYYIAVGDDAHGGEEEEVVEVSFADLLAAADAGKGERVFNKCKACHKLEDGANGTGPHLFGVMGREIAAVSGFGYSDALAGHGGTWDAETMSAWLENPKGFAPGNKMSFAGLDKAEDRANLIAYLQTIGG